MTRIRMAKDFTSGLIPVYRKYAMRWKFFRKVNRFFLIIYDVALLMMNKKKLVKVRFSESDN